MAKDRHRWENLAERTKYAGRGWQCDMFFKKMHKIFKDIKFTKKGSINLMSRFFAMRVMSLVCILLVSLLEVPVFSEELKTYHSNGKLDRLENFKNGKHDGISKKFSPKGKLVGEWVYRDGHLEGTSKIYYENNNLKMESNFVHGKREGISREYFSNEALWIEESYRQGKLEGVSN